MELNFFTSLLGVRCALCGNSSEQPHTICASCRWHFRHFSDELAKGTLAHGPAALGALAYDGWWRTVVLHQKGARTPLGIHLLSQVLLNLVRRTNHFQAQGLYSIMPIPGRLGELPHLVELLAQHMAQASSTLQYAPVLRHRLHYRLLQPQKNADRATRIETQDRFKIVKNRRPKSALLPIILVDDVVSTGATLREATKTLTQAGGHVVGSVVLAINHRT